MNNKTASKRKKDKHSDNEDDRKEKKTSRRRRSTSRSPRDREKDTRRKRRHSRSSSPNVPVKQERRRDDAQNDEATKKTIPERKAKETDMLNTRTGGAYIPPARLRMMQAQITDKSSVAYQRLAWEALKKSIHGHINKINVGNIGIIIKELLKENIVRGRGLLCRSVIQAQAASPTFTNVYAALVAAVNSRFPNIGELLLKRLVIQFKRGFKRNDKSTCISSASFIAHLVNQRVAHEILALELLTLLVESPTDDSVEVAIAFLKECGQKLTEVSSKGVNAIFEMLRNILHEGHLDKRVQYMIEVMFQVWKDGFKDHPALIEELELVPEEEQFTHLLMLDDATDPQDILNVFKFDDKYEENEQKYKTLSKEILGSDAESGEEDGSEESGSGESEEEEEQEGEQKGMTIIDNTETNLVALRRTIYLTINSSLDFEECAHKLMKMQLKPGQEVELCHMFLDCCAEQRTYEKFYGLLAQRFCNINRIYIGPFEEIFKDSYSTAHRLDTNRLRNVSKFFAHLLFTDSISWEVMECVKLNEEDTTSSSRIYIKILFQELAEYMGLKKLNDRLRDPTLQDAFSGIFPCDNPKNTRFSINFFTSIGLGGLTDELREHLKQMPKNIPAPVTDINVDSESSSSSSSSDSSSDSSSSDSEVEDEKDKKKSKKSTEKNKSKENDEETNKDKNDKDQRWGHDGFYETYGENARRHDVRPERSEQRNFTRPRDTRYEHRGNNLDDDRGNRNDRNNRDMNEHRNNRNTRNNDEIRDSRLGSDNRRREEERSYDKKRNNAENNSNERKGEKSVRDRSDREERRRDDNTDTRRDNRTEDKRQDRDQRLDRDLNSRRDDSTRDKRDNDREKNDRAREDERYKEDNRTRERYSEKENRDKGYVRNDRIRDNYSNKNYDDTRDRNSGRENRDKGQDRNDRTRDDDRNSENDANRGRYSENERKNKGYDRNDRVRQSDRYRDHKTKESHPKSREKDCRQNEIENRVLETREKNGTNNKSNEKTSDSNNEEDSKRREKGGKSKEFRKEIKSSNKEIEKRTREDKGKKERAKDSKEKQKVKKNNKKKSRNKRNKESSGDSSSSTDSSSSESSSVESDNEQTGGRYWDSFDIEKPLNKDKESTKSLKMKEKTSDRRKER